MAQHHTVSTNAIPNDREAIIAQHMDLARGIAKNIAQRVPARIELGDLVQAGI